jgi:hypothetical protein
MYKHKKNQWEFSQSFAFAVEIARSKSVKGEVISVHFRCDCRGHYNETKNPIGTRLIDCQVQLRASY